MKYSEMEATMFGYFNDTSIKALSEKRKYEIIKSKIKSNKDLIYDYIEFAISQVGCKNVVMCENLFNEAYDVLRKRKLNCSLFKTSNTLISNKNKPMCPIEFSFMYKDKDFIFIDIDFDDIVFDCIKSYIESAGGNVVATYTFYNKSLAEKDNVYSLHNCYELKKENVTSEVTNKDIVSGKSTKSKLYSDHVTFGLFADVINSTFNTEHEAYVHVEVIDDVNSKEKRIVITKRDESEEFKKSIEKTLEFFSTLEHMNYNQKQMKAANDKMKEVMEMFLSISKNGD